MMQVITRLLTRCVVDGADGDVNSQNNTMTRTTPEAAWASVTAVPAPASPAPATRTTAARASTRHVVPSTVTMTMVNSTPAVPAPPAAARTTPAQSGTRPVALSTATAAPTNTTVRPLPTATVSRNASYTYGGGHGGFEHPSSSSPLWNQHRRRNDDDDDDDDEDPPSYESEPHAAGNWGASDDDSDEELEDTPAWVGPLRNVVRREVCDQDRDLLLSQLGDALHSLHHGLALIDDNNPNVKVPLRHALCEWAADLVSVRRNARGTYVVHATPAVEVPRTSSEVMRTVWPELQTLCHNVGVHVTRQQVVDDDDACHEALARERDPLRRGTLRVYAHAVRSAMREARAFFREASNKLELLNELILLCGRPAQPSITKARAQIVAIHVNIYDLRDAQQSGEPPRMFATVRELAIYTFKNNLIFPKKAAKESDGFLRLFLRKLVGFRTATD
jgi:hypothetical protein